MHERTTQDGAGPWQAVAPLLQCWQIALLPHDDSSWDVLAGYPGGWTGPVHSLYGIAFADLPLAIADLAARCQALLAEEETERPAP